jgi:hypothetical protein
MDLRAPGQGIVWPEVTMVWLGGQAGASNGSWLECCDNCLNGRLIAVSTGAYERGESRPGPIIGSCWCFY